MNLLKKIKVWRNRKYLRENLLCEVEVCKEVGITILNNIRFDGDNEAERVVVCEPYSNFNLEGYPAFKIKRTIDISGEILNLDKTEKELGIRVYLIRRGEYRYSDKYFIYKDRKVISELDCPPIYTHITDVIYGMYEIEKTDEFKIKYLLQIENFCIDDYA